ncbi:MAG: aromatic aminobenezylarsenical efflux permease ArsG family transporter [Bacteroidales bacterium]
MELIQTLLDNSNTPIITAFLLGLLTAISPCPLTTNITAIGYISKDIESRHRIFWGGVLYTTGRVLSYTILGFILIPILKEGASMFAIQKTIGKYGEILIAPTLLLIGLFMLLGHKLNLPKVGFSGNKFKGKGAWGALLLGVLFSLAFCPSSGIFYFGMLIPMAAIESGGYLLPVFFAIGTGLPVMLAAWILAYSVVSLGRFYNRMQSLQKWLNKIIAVLFIAVGTYYLFLLYLS